VRSKRADDQLTRRRLIEVATRQFGALGYKHVTIRAICREARANVAAVNYHFRDKMGLYREVLESAFAVLRDTTERAIRAGQGTSAEEKLRAYIRVHSEAILATQGPSAIQQLLHREMHEPTVGLDSLINRTLKPRFEYLFKVVGELLDLPPHDQRVTLSAFSIHGLIIMFRPNPMSERFGAQLKLKFTPERITEHLLTFSLTALEAYQRGRQRAQGSRLKAQGSGRL
jgi:TetR/AcrR family transcriptional regulator, regulator of cefoperazone and chloramphenicol sensitivity